MGAPGDAASEPVVGVEVADGVATIRLNRPPMNALNRAVQDGLHRAAAEVTSRTEVSAVVLYGGPKLFAAGADIKEMAGASYAEMTERSAHLTGALDAIARIPKPVVAAVTGYALGGGCELALTADRRIAAREAKFGQPEVKLGLMPGAGGTQRLPRLIGPARAKDLIFTGRTIDAEEALAFGLVDELVDADEARPDAVLEAARSWAAAYVGGPALAIAAAKTSIDRGLDVDLAAGLELERQAFAGLFATEDARAGTTAFVEKTTPTFEGR